MSPTQCTAPSGRGRKAMAATHTVDDGDRKDGRTHLAARLACTTTARPNRNCSSAGIQGHHAWAPGWRGLPKQRQAAGGGAAKQYATRRGRSPGRTGCKPHIGWRPCTPGWAIRLLLRLPGCGHTRCHGGVPPHTRTQRCTWDQQQKVSTHFKHWPFHEPRNAPPAAGPAP